MKARFPFRSGRSIALAALMLATVAPLARPAPLLAAPSEASQNGLAGRWTGLVEERRGDFSRRFPIDIEIVERDGGLYLVDHERGRAGGAPLPLRRDGDRWRADFPATPAGATSISIAASGRDRLDYRIDNAGPLALSHFQASLRHDDPRVRAFDAPRIDSAGNRVADYRYRVPSARADGFPVASAAAEGVDSGKLEALVRAVLAEKSDANGPQIEGIVIVRNGKLVLEEYFWGQSADNPHEISSCTKSLTAMITGAAWDQGLIDLERPIASYFPEYGDSLWARQNYPITVRNVLSMASGTEWDDISSSGKPSLLLLASKDIAGYMFGQPLEAAPGSKYNYNNGLPALQGLLVERVTKEPFARFADRTLLAPLGIRNYSWVTTHDHDRPLAAGGFIMRPLDAAKLGQLMLDDGVWKGKRLLSSAWVRQSTTQQTAAGDYPYGFYWHLINAAQPHVAGAEGYSAIGQGGQLITIFPKQKTVVVITSAAWRMSAISRAKGTPLAMISDYIVPALPQ